MSARSSALRRSGSGFTGTLQVKRAAALVEGLETRRLLAASPFGPAVAVYSGEYTNIAAHPIDLNGDNKADLVITDGSGTAARVKVAMNNGSGGYGAAVQIWSGTQTPEVEVAQLNADTRPDLVITQPNGNGNAIVSVLLNDGSGGFSAPVQVHTSNAPLYPEVVDLNGDGRDDLLIRDMTVPSAQIVVAMNSGNGAFGAGVQAWSGASLTSIEIADLTHDGRADLILNTGGGFMGATATLWTMLNNGNGTFTSPTSTYTSTGQTLFPYVQDLTGDGAADIVAMDYNYMSGTGALKMLRNGGGGAFATPTQIWSGDGMVSLAMIDLNDDTRSDLVIGSQGNSSGADSFARVLMNNGSGVFAPAAQVYSGSGSSVMVTPMELTGDGVLDLVFQELGWGGGTDISFALNNGSGGFSAQTHLWSGLSPTVQGAQLNGDGRLDLVISQPSNTISEVGYVETLLNDGTGAFGTPTRAFTGVNQDVVAFALDFSGDGRADLLVGDSREGASRLAYVANNGAGTFGEPAVVWSGARYPAAIPADLTGDGLPDILLGQDAVAPNPSSLSVFLNNSTPAVTPHAPTNIALSAATVSEGQPSGTTVGTLTATDVDPGETFTFSLVPGTVDNAAFEVAGNTLRTAESFVYATKHTYSVRVRVTDSTSRTFEKTFTINVTVAPVTSGTFGTINGKAKSLTVQDDDNDQVTLKLTGPGTGTLRDDGQLVITGTGATSTVSVKVIKAAGGDGMVHLNGIVSEGILKSISAPGVILEGALIANMGRHVPGRTKLTLSLGRVIDGSITVNDLPLSSLTLLDWQNTGEREKLEAPTIGTVNVTGRKENSRTPAIEFLAGDMTADISAGSIGTLKVAGRFSGTVLTPGAISTMSAKGGIVDSRIVATNGIKSLTALSLIDSDVLVGMNTDFGDRFATEFTNVEAKLTTLNITGKTLPRGSTYPVYVSGSHISAPTAKSVTLTNVAADTGVMVHVDNDTGTLKIVRKSPAETAVLDALTSRTAGARPAVWEVV